MRYLLVSSTWTGSLLIIFLFFLTCYPLPAKEFTSLFVTPKASEVGDTLTIIISEFSTASQTANTDFEKSTEANGEIELPGEAPSVGWGYSTDYKGSGSTRRRGSLNAKITVQVTEVLPGGNLKVKGRKTVRINQEEQIISLEGIIRPEDIGPNNTVLSTKIARAHITYDGQGPVSEGRKPGIIVRLLGWLGIF